MTNERCVHCPSGLLKLTRHEFIIGFPFPESNPYCREMRLMTCDHCRYSCMEVNPVNYEHVEKSIGRIFKK